MPRIEKYARNGIAFLLAAYCLLLTAYGQTTGGVKGKVRNLNGDGIANATVTAHQNQKEIKTVHTARGGDFVLDGLEAGLYNIVIEANGYSTGVKYDVQVKAGKPRDMGANLILQVDRGSQVLIRGSVFYKDGFAVPGCEVRVSLVSASGAEKSLTTLMTGVSGEFSYRRPEGKATYRFTANFRGVTASRDLTVDSPAIYTTSVLLPIKMGDKQP
ncbi:MAG: carboxypeptidase regulatory-like domain-containing protein [Acidobacteria bacterium]|nr:carboxypeptidase regulatory-like domain-containing protein [Acidobacteriota bacterium]